MVKRWQDVSILIVGCGSIGKRHARVLRGLGVGDLRACDPVASQREALAAASPDVTMYDSYEAGLASQPDAAFICTPPWLHVPQAMQAIQAGCHVFCEKPLSDSLNGVDELEAMVSAAGKKAMVGFCFRYHEGLLKAKGYLDSGRVGRLVSVRAMVGEHLPDVRPDYRTLFSSRVSGAFDLIHEIDLALWYADQSVRRVVCFYGRYSDIGIEAPDLAEVLLDFEGHCLASIHLDFFQQPRRRQMELLCTDGAVIVEFARWDRCTISVYDANKQAWDVQEMLTDRDDMFRAEDREFLEAVAGDKPILSTIQEAKKSVAIVESARQAGATH